MIDLGGPSTVFNGISVLSDYSDKQQFYYLPPAPRLALDAESQQRVFKLIKLAGGLTDPASDSLAAGLLFFDCNLALTEQEESDLLDHVRSTFRPGPGPIKVSPLLYKQGEVTCYVLGEQDWQDDAPPERANLFVERLQGFGKPSLYGENRASFSARLSQEGASVLEASLAAAGPIGISVVYSLTFDALAPAFNFKIEADWERIYSFIEEKCGVDLFFVRVESTSIIEELEERQLLRIEEVVYDPAASADVAQLRKQLQQYVLEKFFTPVLSVGDPQTNKIPGMIGDVLRSTIVVPCFGYQRRELTQEERRVLSFEVSRVAAVERTIYPQANLFALIPREELPGYIVEVNTDADLFYRKLDVRCVLGGFDFASSKIAWVHPYIRYGAAPEEGTDKTLAARSDELPFQAWLQEGHGFQYRTSYEVAFFPADPTDPEAIFGQALRLASPEQRKSDRVLAINPRELFDVRAHELVVRQGFPWDRYPSIALDVSYDDDTGFSAQKSFALSAEQPRALFRVRTRPGQAGVTRYRVVYHRAVGQGRGIPFDWEVANESLVLIDNPFPQRSSIRVHVAESAAELAWADVSLRFRDAEHPGTYQEGRLFFEEPKPQTWSVDTADPTQRRYQYRFTIFFKDNTVFEAPTWIDADSPTLTLGRRLPVQRTVSVALDDGDFAAQALRDVMVTLWSADELADAPGTALSFSSAEQLQQWTYRASSALHVGYRYQIFYRWLNGRTQDVNGTSPEGALELMIPTETRHSRGE